MLLALVIKNDTVSLGVFDGGALRTSAAVATDTEQPNRKVRICPTSR
jgi:hypothetical protein